MIASTDDLLGILQGQRLLSAEQLALFAKEAPAFDARALARNFVQRGWLTPYQVNELFLGRGRRLLLGSYVLLELLGEGGMGQVLKARNWKLGHTVAIKLIRKERLSNPTAIKRFYREIRAAATLEHPNIVRAFDADEVDGTHFFVMEFVEGTDLNKLVKTDGPLDVRQACDYVRQAALGLQHAHERGLVHRDIKPHNLLAVRGQGSGVRGQNKSDGSGLIGENDSSLTPDPCPLTALVKILDMGLARIDSDADGEHSSTMTQEGAVMGTPDYIAPEQALDSHRVDIRADLYSLGCTFYFLLSGRVPFPGGEMMNKLMRHQNENAESLETVRPEVSTEVSAIVRKLMAKRPADRFQTPAELAFALEGIKLHTSGTTSPERTASSTSGTEVDPKLARQWADVVAPTAATAALVKPPLQFAPATRKPMSWRWLAAGGGAALMLLILLFWQPWRHGGEQPIPDGNVPSKHKPSAAELAKQEERKRQQLAAQAEKKRLAEAEEALEPIAARVALLAAGASPAGDALRRELREFLMKHSATPAATKACGLLGQVLVKLPSPLDQLEHKKLPQDCIAYWRALGREPIPELVSVLGEHRRRHWGTATRVAFSPDGKRVASSGEDAVVRIWDSETGRELLALKVKTGAWGYLAFHPDGQSLAARHGETSIGVWHLPTGELRHTLEASNVSSVVFTEGGKKLVSGSNDGTVKVWDPSTGKEMHSLKLDLKDAHRVWLSPSGQWLVSAHKDSTLGIWDTTTGQKLHTLRGHPAPVSDVAFDPRSEIIASANDGDGAIRLWDISKGTHVQTFPRLGRYSLAFRPDGKLLASGEYGLVQLLDLKTGMVVRTLSFNCQGGCWSVTFDPTGKFLATAYSDGTVRLWDVATGKEVQPLTGHSGAVNAVAISPDGKTLASGSNDYTIKLWDPGASSELRTLKGLINHVYSVAFSPDGKTLASGSYDQTVKLWDPAAGSELRTLNGHPQGAYSVAFSPDGKTLAAGSGHDILKLWDPATGRELRTLRGHPAGVRSVAFSPDGKTLASGSWEPTQEGTVKLWDPAAGSELRTLKTQTRHVYSVAFSPDGKTLASGSGDGTLKLWDPAAGSELRTLIGHTGIVQSVAFSPDGKTLGSASQDGRVVLWNPTNGTKLREWQLPGPVHAFAFAHDGRHLATANGNGTVYILRIAEGPPRPLSADEAEKQQEDEAKRLSVPVQITNSIGMKLNLIPAGRFLMGSPENEPGRQANEGPRHEVTLTKPFHIGVYEVTQAEYEKVIGKNPSTFNKDNGGGPDHPVETVPWREMVVFCKKLSELPEEKKAGRVYRLPTEAEWEYACRAGTQTAYSFGQAAARLPQHGWFTGNAPDKTCAVGKLLPNAWGLYDMHGNVWEWCSDFGSTYTPTPVTDPLGAPVGSGRALRGGGVLSIAGRGLRAFHLRSAIRFPNYRVKANNVGFRVVCECRPPVITNSIGMKLARIPAGKFLMGSPENEPGRQANEGPQHEVTITKPFHIGVYEVTQAEYEKVTGKNPSHFKKANGGGPNHPAETVSLDEVTAFCKKLSDLPEETKAGRVYRLPTEAEWEYACRAGTQTAYSFGQAADKLPQHGWFFSNAPNKTQPVGKLLPNAWGLYDMHGNVWEWCADVGRIYTRASVTDPLDPQTDPGRVLRGGGVSTAGPRWDAPHLRSAFRIPNYGVKANNVGFRVVCEELSVTP